MAITIDQAQIGTPVHLNTSLGTVAITTNVTVAVGGLIVLVCAHDTPATSDASASGGSLTWVVDKTVQAATSGDVVSIISAPAPAGLASSTTITVTFAGGNSSSRMLGGLSLLGADLTASRVDGTPPAKNDLGTAAWTTTTYSIAAGSAIVAATEIDTTTTMLNITSPSIKAWEVSEATGGNSVSQVYRIESGAGSFPVAGTWNASGTGTSIAVAYKAATSGASWPNLPLPVLAGPGAPG